MRLIFHRISNSFFFFLSFFLYQNFRKLFLKYRKISQIYARKEKKKKSKIFPFSLYKNSEMSAGKKKNTDK
jgi:hypothetical protein